MPSFYRELKRRNVVKVAVAYAIVGWILVEVASVFLPGFEAPEWVFKVVMFLVILGFPMAVLFAWAFEITPEGLKREKDVDRSESITPQTGRKLDRIIIALLVVALGYFVATHDWGGQRQTIEIADDATPTSIAVLPFINMSDDPANEYFSDGLSEELLNLLVKVSDLRVAGRTSSFAFKNKELDLREIGEQLNVDSILEGSVRKAGNKVRITAQLVNTSDGYHLWSETYDRELTDIFVVQADIANNIVTALKGTLAGEEVGTVAASAPTKNLEAYQLYLQGRYLIGQRGGENLRNAADLFNKTIALDPEFAAAYTGAAMANWLFPGYVKITYTDVAEAASKFATRALSLDESQSEAAIVMAAIDASIFHRWSKARAQFEEISVAAADIPFVHHFYAINLASTGYAQEAIDESSAALALDPLSGVVIGWLALGNAALGNHAKAVELAETSIRLGWKAGLFSKSVYSIGAGQFDLAQKELEDVLEVLDEEGIDVAPIFAAMRDGSVTSEALASMKLLEDTAVIWMAPYYYAQLGAFDDGFRTAHVNADGAQVSSMVLFWLPEMAEFRRRPEFVEFVERAGLDDYWREYGWPTYCQPTGDTFACE